MNPHFGSWVNGSSTQFEGGGDITWLWKSLQYKPEYWKNVKLNTGLDEIKGCSSLYQISVYVSPLRNPSTSWCMDSSGWFHQLHLNSTPEWMRTEIVIYCLILKTSVLQVKVRVAICYFAGVGGLAWRHMFWHVSDCTQTNTFLSILVCKWNYRGGGGSEINFNKKSSATQMDMTMSFPCVLIVHSQVLTKVM